MHENFTDITSSILANLGYTFKILGEDSTSIIGGLGHGISQIFDSAGNGASEVVTSMTKGAGNIITSTGGVLKDLIPNIVNIANNILQWMGLVCPTLYVYKRKQLPVQEVHLVERNF